MLEITEKEIVSRLEFDNPWWNESEDSVPFGKSPKRFYFPDFFGLVRLREVQRAIILLGPRRVGKTVMVYQAIFELIKAGIPKKNILYLSLETPVYTGMRLEKFLQLFQEKHKLKKSDEVYVFFDEVQYLPKWEIHLKSLVESFPTYRFVASGSSAAALRLKSRESGAGRFTEFHLPPMTFAEYLSFIDREKELIRYTSGSPNYEAKDMGELNKEFLNYLNFGGYPEAVLNPTIREDIGRFIRSDIIDKVLLRDIPSLYGIDDIQELNRLFTVLAYNTSQEVSLEGLSKTSGVTKNTIKKYMEYLEAAFLIQTIHRIDRNSKRFIRATTFKTYLGNPCMRAALFGSVDFDQHSILGHLAESAIFSQWFHAKNMVHQLHYARWKQGEIDLVYLPDKQSIPSWGVEVIDSCIINVLYLRAEVSHATHREPGRIGTASVASHCTA